MKQAEQIKETIQFYNGKQSWFSYKLIDLGSNQKYGIEVLRQTYVFNHHLKS